MYGILRLINFAHGDLLMMAADVAVMGVGLFSWPWMAVGLAIGVTALMGLLLERGAYRPLRPGSPHIALDLGHRRRLLLENLALVIFGRARPFPVPEIFNGVFAWADCSYPA